MSWYDTLDLVKHWTSSTLWFQQNVQKQVSKLYPGDYISGNEYIHHILPHNLYLCSSITELHPYIRRNSCCRSCDLMQRIEINDLVTSRESIPHALAVLRPEDIHAKSYSIIAHPWVHQQITLCILNVPTIKFSYICNSIGTSLKHTQLPTKDIDLALWLDQLDKVYGFLLYPDANLFDAHGYVNNIQALCWTHPKNKNVRWIGSIKNPLLWMDHSSWTDTSDWDAFFIMNKLGMKNNSKMTRREWNYWMTIFSLWLSPFIDDDEKSWISHKDRELWTSEKKSVEWLINNNK